MTITRTKLQWLRDECLRAKAEISGGRPGKVLTMNLDSILLGTIATWRDLNGVELTERELDEALAKIDADLPTLPEDTTQPWWANVHE